MSFRAQTERELELWVSAFALERESLEEAFAQYGNLLDALEGRDLTDGEFAMNLAQLRKNVRRGAEDEKEAPKLAEHLDDITNRLKRAQANAQILKEDAPDEPEIGGLAARLEAAHTMFATLRAALARRTR